MESMGLKRTTPELFFELREKRKKERKMERSIIEVYKRWTRLDPAQVKKWVVQVACSDHREGYA